MDKLRKSVVVGGEFEATHNWPECPIEEVQFLKHPHRHVFKVQVKVEVDHMDRDIEFIVLKRKLRQYLNKAWHMQHHEGVSCEMMCQDIRNAVLSWHRGVWFVSVYEDGENGAELEVVPRQEVRMR